MRLHLPWKDRKRVAAPEEDAVRGIAEADAAVRKAEQKYEEAKSQGREVKRVVDNLKERQRVNHFRDAVVRSLQPGHEGQGRQHG